ncbi:MAG: hypothetical protein KBB95_23885 [Deltaproteobacteria bacterium]|jgi:hypothetical protein|nr:hypothetical protein [Deltaproteobacteria bacterium]
MNEMSMQTRRTQVLVTTCLVTLMASVGLGQPAQGAVSLGALSVRGPLGRPAIQQVLENSLGSYQACVAQRAGERLSGELSVRVHIEANGVPIAASVDRSNVGDRALERCVAAATEAWRLAERNAATLVTFTLRVGRGEPSGQQRDVGQVISLGDSDDGHLPESARNSQPGGGRPLVLRRTWAPVPGGMHVVGALSEARVAQALRGRTNLLRRCVSVAHVGTGEAAPWEVLVSLRLGPSGQVNQEPVVQVSGAPPSVTACVAAVLRETRFPQATAETQVVARYRAVPRS